MRSLRSVPVLMAVIAVALFVAGCASTAGSIKPFTAAATSDGLARYANMSVATAANGDASTMTPFAQQRIAALVSAKVKELAPNRFANVAATTTDPETLHVTIAFTRYDEGNAFARFMLAGLGQIHIDAEVALEDRALHTVMGKFEVTKTFAWGGLYGGTTGIEDVEAGFAEAVAKAVLGES